MTTAGKMMMILGFVLVVVGAGLWLLGRLGFRGAPGDVTYEGENVRIYIPLVTCLILSLLLSAVLWLWQWIGKK